MCTNQKKALEAQERMKPYIEKAERDAKEMYKALGTRPTEIHELIEPDNLKNRMKKYIYRLAA